MKIILQVFEGKADVSLLPALGGVKPSESDSAVYLVTKQSDDHTVPLVAKAYDDNQDWSVPQQ